MVWKGRQGEINEREEKEIIREEGNKMRRME